MFTGFWVIEFDVFQSDPNINNETTLTGGVAAGAAVTLLGQSQPEAQRPIGPIVAPMRQTIIGCWYVRTMAETTRAGQGAKLLIL